MSKVKIQGNASGTGIFTVAAPATNTDRTITLPDTSSTVFTEAGGTISGVTQINNPSETGYASTAAEGISKATLRIKTHSSDSTLTSFGGMSGGDAYIQRTNGSGSSQYNLRLNPFGGAVLMPNQPCFRVHANNGVAWTFSNNGSAFDPPYNLVKIDTGSNFNSSNYRFTAPVTGNYYIEHCFSYNHSGDGTVEAKVLLNGNETFRSYSNADPDSRGSSTINWCRAGGVVRMNAGDYATASGYNFAGGSITLYGDSTLAIAYFCGYLIG